MMTMNSIPEASYGILQQNLPGSSLDKAVEQVRNLGYAVIDSGCTMSELLVISEEFRCTREHYIKTYGESKLRSLNEFYTVRSLLTHGGEAFLNLALNENLLSMLEKLITGKFILNQQNGLINPSQETYEQSAWHRDLPYQHFISSTSLAINALFCIDDFTFENGATFVLPASHKVEAFPSESYVRRNAIQVEAKAGSFLVLDGMLFHAGGANKTRSERRAVNHLYNIPYFRQQINIPSNMKDTSLSAKAKDILGFNYMEPRSIAQYFMTRKRKKS